MTSLATAVFKAGWQDVCGFIPQRVTRFLQRRPAAVVIRVAKENLIIDCGIKGLELAKREFENWPDQVEEIRSYLKTIYQNKEEIGRQGIAIEFQEDATLHRRLTYPLIAESSLRNIFLSQMSVVSPWAASEAWAGWRIVSRNLGAQEIEVELFVVPKARFGALAQVIDEVASSEPVIGCRMATTPNSSFLKLKRVDDLVQIFKLKNVLNMISVVLPFALISALTYIPLWADQSYLDDLRKEAESLGPAVEASVRLQKETSDLEDEIRSLGNQQTDSRSVIELLAFLSSKAPDSVWLDHLVVAGQKIELSGTASDTYEFMTSLQAENRFSEIRLKSPVVKDQVNGRQKFVMEIQLETAE